MVDKLHILHIKTHPHYRRQGIGSSLLQQAICFAHQERLYRSFLKCALPVSLPLHFTVP
ncbi:GNAT family N-acetyltransferase [Pajaroellobacter abortibovis]|uniref:GNAT family N-acetyltransferase n=1 Tax=Pajaroellobacter abortibovis TaxID=1882918 RepID=UPI0009FB3E64